ncbi:hypothetical protein WDU94_003645 [Cyamophila willieti]
MYFNYSSSIPPPPIQANNLLIHHIPETKFLGLTVDNKMKWKTHIEHLQPKLASSIFAVGSVRQNVDCSAALLSYFSYFHSVMSYAIIFWGFSPHAKPIFILQKRALRTIFGLGWRVSCKPIFRRQGILTFYAQAILDSCVLIKKLSPTLLKHSNVHNYDTRNKEKLITSKAMDKSFLKEGIKLYNKIPPSIKELQNITLFKNALKEHLLELVPYSYEEFPG